MCNIQDVINEAISGVLTRARKLREAVSSFKAEGQVLKIIAKAGRENRRTLSQKLPKLGLFVLQSDIPIEAICIFAEDNSKLQEVPMSLLETYFRHFEPEKISEGALDRRFRQEHHLK